MAEEVISENEILTFELGTPTSKTTYLKFPEKFKDEFDIKTAIPIIVTLIRDAKTTKLCFVFSNDSLKKKKENKEEK